MKIVKTKNLNGRSKFEPTYHNLMAMFEGQLKTKDDGRQSSYGIPLLCPFDTFMRGFDALRAKQAKDGGVAHLTNAEISTKYRSLQSQIGKVFPSLTGWQIKTLRSLYAAFVFELYDCPYNFNATARSPRA